MTQAIFFAPLRVPVTDPATGLMSRPWYLFLQAMFQRVGGSIAPAPDDLEQLAVEDFDVAGAESQVLAQRISDLEAKSVDGDLQESPSFQDVADALALAYSALDDVATALTNVFTAALPGIVPASGGGTVNLLRADGGWSNFSTGPFGIGAAPAGTWLLDLQAASALQRIHSTTAGNGVTITYTINSVDQAYSGVAGTAGQLITGSAAGDRIERVVAGNVLWSTDNGATVAMKLSIGGALTFKSALGINGNAAPAQVTGWGVPAGPAVVATFPATPTLAQCGQAIGQIIKDLKAVGLYGA